MLYQRKKSISLCTKMTSKNVKSRGPSKFEMDSSMWLIPYIKEYVCKRQDLLSGKSHSFMFMIVTGLPSSSSSFTAYVSGLFQKEVSIRAGTTKLRHALVPHVLSLPEVKSLRLRESLVELINNRPTAISRARSGRL